MYRRVPGGLKIAGMLINFHEVKQMNAFKVVELIDKYGKCPKCGNEMLGEGQGKLIVEEDSFTRECSCGFKVTIKEK